MGSIHRTTVLTYTELFNAVTLFVTVFLYSLKILQFCCKIYLFITNKLKHVWFLFAIQVCFWVKKNGLLASLSYFVWFKAYIKTTHMLLKYKEKKFSWQKQRKKETNTYCNGFVEIESPLWKNLHLPLSNACKKLQMFNLFLLPSSKK